MYAFVRFSMNNFKFCAMRSPKRVVTSLIRRVQAGSSTIASSSSTTSLCVPESERKLKKSCARVQNVLKTSEKKQTRHLKRHKQTGEYKCNWIFVPGTT
jgi:thiamine phosphate synthase YjbQ (UPF0047 family)